MDNRKEESNKERLHPVLSSYALNLKSKNSIAHSLQPPQNISNPSMLSNNNGQQKRETFTCHLSPVLSTMLWTIKGIWRKKINKKKKKRKEKDIEDLATTTMLWTLKRIWRIWRRRRRVPHCQCLRRKQEFHCYCPQPPSILSPVLSTVRRRRSNPSILSNNGQPHCPQPPTSSKHQQPKHT